MTLKTLLGIELPIVQAPMAGAQLSELAAAVSNAGGLGSLPCAMLDMPTLQLELAALKERTRKPVNVNFACHVLPAPDAERESRWRAALGPYYEEFGIDAASIPMGAGRAPFTADVADAVGEWKPSVVSFYYGLPPAELLARVKSWGSKILASATTVEEARWLEARGVDAIIAQGLEAGGHRSMFLSHDLATQAGTLALVPQVVRAVGIPVIATGGIADAQGVEAALALGAAGVQLGTAYLLCPEARTSAVHRAALTSESARRTELTNLFTGGVARGIVNRLMREIGAIDGRAPPFPLATAAIAPLRSKAEATGRGDFSPLWAGQNVTGCKALPAAALTRELAGLT